MGQWQKQLDLSCRLTAEVPCWFGNSILHQQQEVNLESVTCYNQVWDPGQAIEYYQVTRLSNFSKVVGQSVLFQG